MHRSLVGNTPLIELSSGVLAKLETYNPTGSVKDRIIHYIVNKAVANNDIKKGTTLVEATSGNTGISLSAIGASLDLEVKIIMPSNMSEERKKMMRFFGAQIIEVAPYDFKAAIALRNKMVLQGHWSPNQFENGENIQCHFKTTGPEIHKQLLDRKYSWSAFISGAGTGGTMMGVTKYIRTFGIGAKSILMIPREKDHGIQGVGDGDDYLLKKSSMDSIYEIKTIDAKDRCLSLSRELGIPVGISAAANVLTAEKYLQQNKPAGKVVTLICDRGERYLSSFSKRL